MDFSSKEKVLVVEMIVNNGELFSIKLAIYIVEEFAPLQLTKYLYTGYYGHYMPFCPKIFH